MISYARGRPLAFIIHLFIHSNTKLLFMQYILTQEEYNSLKRLSDQHREMTRLVDIMGELGKDSKNVYSIANGFISLTTELEMNMQDGLIQDTLRRWEKNLKLGDFREY